MMDENYRQSTQYSSMTSTSELRPTAQSYEPFSSDPFAATAASFNFIPSPPNPHNPALNRLIPQTTYGGHSGAEIRTIALDLARKTRLKGEEMQEQIALANSTLASPSSQFTAQPTHSKESQTSSTSRQNPQLSTIRQGPIVSTLQPEPTAPLSPRSQFRTTSRSRSRSQSQSQTLPRSRSCSRVSPASQPHIPTDKELAQKWSQPSIASSRLLAGSALFPHLPGAQYCIDAGLHHHHFPQSRPQPEHEKASTQPPPQIELDLDWFSDMERKLRALSEQFEDALNDSELNRAKYAALVQRLEEMSRLQKERFLAEQERRKKEEEERDRRERELATAWERYCTKMVAVEREKWFRELEALRLGMKKEVDHLTEGMFH